MKKVVVETATGIVSNVIEILGDTNWTPPEGCQLVAYSVEAEIGGKWDGAAFSRAPKPSTALTPDQKALVDAAKLSAPLREVARRFGLLPLSGG